MKLRLPNFKGSGVVRAYTRSTLYALVLTLASVLLLALVVKYAGISDGAIKPIVQIIKALSVFTGVAAVLRSIEKRAWMHGGILGLIYTVLAFFALSTIDSNFSITGGFFVEAAFALAVGIASAMLLRLRKREI
ncbi:MAG: TIGR04086 family membrane protein [Christensenellaceae bacterium]|jgi:putative membrane protein (TIGR04086 family)|nr:TIGR04086 family membrane protein [Christensenellaceae bacterium]